MSIYKDAADALAKAGMTSLVDGERRVLTEKDVKKILDHIARTLYTEGSGTTLEFANLIVRRTNEHCDVFVRVGEMLPIGDNT